MRVGVSVAVWSYVEEQSVLCRREKESIGERIRRETESVGRENPQGDKFRMRTESVGRNPEGRKIRRKE